MRLKSYIKLLESAIKNKAHLMPYKLNLAVTNRCNSRCITCRTWREYRVNPEMQSNELSVAEFGRLFHNLSSYIRWLSLTGGEPFLREDFSEIVNAAIKKIRSLALINIPTNGLLHDRIINFIDSLKNTHYPEISISFSIDGPSEVHDRIRGIKGSYDIVWNTYLESKKIARRNSHIHLHIETTVSSFNISKLKLFVKELRKNKHTMIITIAHDAYLYHNEGDTSILPNIFDTETGDFFSFLKREFRGYHPSEILTRAYIKRIPMFLRNRSSQVLPCAAMESSFAMNPYGDVLPCLMWDKLLGNVRDFDFRILDILSTESSVKLRQQIIESRCPNCWTPCEAIPTIIKNVPLSLI